MESVPLPRFYVYTLAYPDGRVFYVGKGSGKRIDCHERDARKGVSTYKCRIIRKIWAGGGELIKTIVFRTDDEQEAFATEKRLIAAYGRKSLVNHTDGGQGHSGRPLPAEVRAKISAKLKGHAPTRTGAHSPATRARIGAAHRGKVMSPESRAKMRVSMKGRVIPESTRQAVSRATRGRTVSAETREKIAAAKRGLKRGSEVGQKVAAKRAKTYSGLVSPEGVIYHPIVNMQQFCREHGLNRGNISSLYAGRDKSVKGWILYQPDEVNHG